jgi:CheY-like chemotaxis protein
MPVIVVADDELPIAQLLEDILTDEGYTIYLAADGQEALTLVRKLIPDLLLCDMMMPMLSGEDVYIALQTDPKTAKIPVILMSAAATRSERTQKIHFIAKPFELPQLLNVIKRSLKRM